MKSVSASDPGMLNTRISPDPNEKIDEEDREETKEEEEDPDEESLDDQL